MKDTVNYAAALDLFTFAVNTYTCSTLQLVIWFSNYLSQYILYSGTGRGDMHASVIWIAMLQHAITCMQWSRARREQMAELLVGCDSILIQICL